MKVNVEINLAGWRSDTPPAGTRLVVVKSPWFDRKEYLCLVRTAIINGECVTVGIGCTEGADECTLLRLDAEQLSGWLWRPAVQGESLTVAA
jgi:hypothetical protein